MTRTLKALVPLGIAIASTHIFFAMFYYIGLKAVGVLMVLLVALLGIWAAVDPKGFFMYWYRWELLMLAKHPEPSEIAINLIRFEGIVTVIVCITLMLVLFTKG